MPVPTDWSHQHVIFSKPATPEVAARVNRDPRYWQQRYRTRFQLLLPAAHSDSNVFAPQAELRQSAVTGRRTWEVRLRLAPETMPQSFPSRCRLPIVAVHRSRTSSRMAPVLKDRTRKPVSSPMTIFTRGVEERFPLHIGRTTPGGQILTSPGYSGNGKQLAFVQTDAALEGNLVLLKWAASTTESVGSPATLTSVSAAAYAACPSPPCMTTFLLTNTSGTPADDRTSSVFYDYIDDIAWVGDSHGWLHKFTPVFNGTPAEVRIGGWPVQVNTGNSLSDPVHDSLSGNVFVGDAGGYLYRVSPTGAVIKSGQLDFATGIAQGPVVDSAAGTVYVFASSDNTGQLRRRSELRRGLPAEQYFCCRKHGHGSAGRYFVGELLVRCTLAVSTVLIKTRTTRREASTCAGTPGPNPILYRIPIQLGILGTPATVASLTPAAKTSPCSPVTDVFNPSSSGGASERLFFGVQNFAHPTLCASKGCALSFVDMPWQASTPFQVGQEILVLKTVTNALYVNVAIAAGTSGATAPTWPSAVGSVTVDGGVTWFNQGPTTVAALANWTATHFYALRTRIVDSNGNVEIVSTAGTSGSPTHPTWKTTLAPPPRTVP